MMRIKDLKHSQIFYCKDDKGKPYGFKAWNDAYKIGGNWYIEAECFGNYSYTFDESHKDILYATEDLR